MKKGDTLFNEQFIILHDDDDNREIILKKSEIVVIASYDNYDGSYVTLVSMVNNEQYIVRESVEEIIELL